MRDTTEPFRGRMEGTRQAGPAVPMSVAYHGEMPYAATWRAPSAGDPHRPDDYCRFGDEAPVRGD